MFPSLETQRLPCMGDVKYMCVTILSHAKLTRGESGILSSLTNVSVSSLGITNTMNTSTKINLQRKKVGFVCLFVCFFHFSKFFIFF